MSEQEQAGSPAEASQGAEGAEPTEPGTTAGEAANPELEEANANRGSQGEQVPADATTADQDRAVAQSPPPPSAQSGVPDLPENQGERPTPGTPGATPAEEQPAE